MSYLSCVYSPKFGECEKQAGKDKVGISESNSRGLTKALVTQGNEKNNEECNSSRYGISFHIYTNNIWF